MPLLTKTEANHTTEMLDVVTQSQQGDQEAFHHLFRRYSKPILSFIYNMIGEESLSEELTQETFVRAYRNLKTLKDTSKFSSWLFGIAKNTVRESLKESATNRYVELTEINLETLETPDKQMINSELNEAIKQAVLGLNEDWRIVFTLKMFQQKSYEEIAEITGWSIGKIKTDLHRARLEMRNKLQNHLA
ncbi:MAG: RNA polymerase sigma-70 factor ECF subfamily [bacterium]|nr:MAG: RNA polymerase sigma-70 factor ECF subfamily [bacterium]